MFESTKVIRDLALAEIVDSRRRKEYSFGNQKHGKQESREQIYRLMQKLCRSLVKSAGIELEVSGEAHLASKEPVLYVATHKSMFDIVILLTLINEPVIFIGKKEVKSMPVVSRWFDALGCIYIDREDMRKALQSILEGVNELKSGQSVILFPEGTRNMSNEINSFKEGGFKLATKSKVPIVPIALSDTYKIFEEKGRIKRTKVVVNIGEKIMTSELSKDEITNLPKMVQAQVETLMKKIK